LGGKGVDLEAISDTIYNCDNVRIMNVLISHGLKVDVKRGGQQLLRACMRGDYDMVRLLGDNGADMNIVDEEDGMTPLMIAIKKGEMDISTYLISKGADLDFRDNDGNTALIHAIRKGAIHLACMMIEKGANTRYRDMDGNNALMVQMGNPSSPLYILTLLLNTGMSPDTQNNDGMTPLMKAALMRDPSYLLELLKHGANPNIRNNNGDTALIIASRHRMVEHVRLLLEYGAHTNIKNVNGETAYTATYSTEIRNMISRYSSSTMTGHRWRGRYTDIASV
jgi:ankyrin repeat protein